MPDRSQPIDHWQNNGRACWGDASIETWLCTNAVVRQERMKSEVFRVPMKWLRGFRTEINQKLARASARREHRSEALREPEYSTDTRSGDERESSSELSGPFVEVFSGPNAPLGRAVARRILAVSGKGVGNELNSLAQFLEGKDSNGPLPSSNVLGVGNETWLRRAAVQIRQAAELWKASSAYIRQPQRPRNLLEFCLGACSSLR